MAASPIPKVTFINLLVSLKPSYPVFFCLYSQSNCFYHFLTFPSYLFQLFVFLSFSFPNLPSFLLKLLRPQTSVGPMNYVLLDSQLSFNYFTWIVPIPVVNPGHIGCNIFTVYFATWWHSMAILLYILLLCICICMFKEFNWIIPCQLVVLPNCQLSSPIFMVNSVLGRSGDSHPMNGTFLKIRDF